MKSIVVTVLFAGLMSLQLNAQVQAPSASPGAEFEQTVGLTEVTVTYSRPAMRGRTIFAEDGLVRFGDIWRTGANAATKVSFSGAAKIGNSRLEAGDYAILSKPGKNEWEVMFYPYESWDFNAYKEKTPVATYRAKVMKTGWTIESFLITVDEITMNDAKLVLAWENTAVAVPFKVDTDKAVMASIEKVMAGPTANDYFAAATYYHESGKDLEQALEWVQKANAQGSQYWTLRREALILADLGRKEEAAKVAQKSLEMAKKAGNMDYVRMNEASLKEWQ